MNTPRKIRVLVVDDCAVVRGVLSTLLKRDPELEVVGTAADPYEARDRILDLEPDVLTLDIDMPRMDGLTFLRVLEKHRPTPVVIVSSMTPAGSVLALDALSAGAVDVMAKPDTASWSASDVRQQIIDRVKGAARARLSARTMTAAQGVPISAPAPGVFNPRQLIVMGASTGGTSALTSVLTQLPEGLPGMCIVQHIPPTFSRAFAERLNDRCAFEVREAEEGDEVRPGLALIAPGDFHMSVDWQGGAYRVHLQQTPPVHHTRPAVDVLFDSAAASARGNALGVLLTGMGSDGAAGMQKLKDAGATTLAQDEETCVVYGMPRAAVELGAVDQVVPLDRMPDAMLCALDQTDRGNED